MIVYVLKKLSEGKKGIGERVHTAKPLLCDANYDHEKNNYTNVLRPRRYNWCDFFTNFIRYYSICTPFSTYQVFSQVLL